MRAKANWFNIGGSCLLLITLLTACGTAAHGNAPLRGSSVARVGSISGSVLSTGGPLVVKSDQSVNQANSGTPQTNQTVDLKSGNDVIATTKTDGQGSFTFEAAPGTYTLVVKSCPGISPVTLKAGATVKVDVNCSIR